MNHMKSIKLKIHTGGDIIDFFTGILVDAEHLDRDRVFKPEHIGYIT